MTSFVIIRNIATYCDEPTQVRPNMSSEEFFARNPVFTRAEFAASRARSDAGSERTVDALLAYHVREGNLLRVRRGLYAVVPLGFTPDTAPIDGYLIASKLAEDAVLGYHTALELSGFAYSSSERFLYLTQQEIGPLEFRSSTFSSVLVPKPLRDADAAAVGVTHVDRWGLAVAATTLERTLVDVLDRPDLGGGWEEVWRSLESVGFFAITEIIDYALLLGNKTTIAKVGFFLEQHGTQLSVGNEHLERLREHAPRQPHYVKGSRDAANALLSDWNIVVPTAIVERSWRDVS